MKKLLLFAFTFISTGALAANDVIAEIEPIQTQWAIVKYQMAESEQAQAYQSLIEDSEKLVAVYPDRAEPLIWQAIILSSYAGAVGGIKSVTKALPAVKKARKLLEAAENIDPTALGGSIYTTLGALYYQVPGWPIGFGDKKQARYFLEKAVSNNPNKLNAAFFYGDFLTKQKDYQKAKEVLEIALNEPNLDNRPVADQGRRDEINALLETVRSKIKN